MQRIQQGRWGVYEKMPQDPVVNALTYTVLPTFIPLNEMELQEVKLKLSCQNDSSVGSQSTLGWRRKTCIVTVGQQALHFPLNRNMAVASESRSH